MSPCTFTASSRDGSRAELILVDGLVTEIRYRDVAGRAPLGQSEMRYFEEIVSARAAEIVT
jgi:hypothetical protein